MALNLDPLGILDKPISAVVGVIAWIRLRKRRTIVRRGADADLATTLAEIDEDQAAANQQVLEGMAARGTVQSSLYANALADVKVEHDRRREAARRAWRLQLETAGIDPSKP